MPKTLPPPPGRYIDPLDDYAFKRIFGSEPNKDLLIDFLNQVFRGRKVITNLTYSKTEHPGTATEGGIIFDLSCTGSDGEQFIIEVQRGSQQYFRERAVFYTSRLINNLAPRGKRKEWNYQLPEVYLIALLEKFSLQPEGEKTDGSYLYDVCLCNRETGVPFYDKLNYTYIELRHFTKPDAELKTDLDRWLYVLKHLSSMDKLPAYLRKPIFTKLFQIAEYNNMTQQERQQYDRSQMRYWDEKNVMDFAVKEAVKEAREDERKKTAAEKDSATAEKNKENARFMKQKEYSFSDISVITGLSMEEIEAL